MSEQLYESILETLTQTDKGTFGRLLVKIINEVSKIERANALGAEPYERNESRRGYANGFKDKTMRTTLGNLKFSVPQVRGDIEFYPTALEKGIRSEKAMKIAMAEMYINGVSTRKVTSIFEAMCGVEVSSSEVSRAAKMLDEEFFAWRNRAIGEIKHIVLDARYEKVRESGAIVDRALFSAIGVTATGHRMVLGVSVSSSEAEVHWRKFLESLLARGMHGLLSVTSDAHSGLKSALRQVLPSVPWQRCQFHLQQNAQAYVPKVSMRSEVASDIRMVFNAPDICEANRYLKQIVEKYSMSAPKLSVWMETNIPEGFTVFTLPKERQKKLRTSNSMERLNRELHRRTRVVSIFPNDSALERLATGILIEISEEWESGKCYMKMDAEVDGK